MLYGFRPTVGAPDIVCKRYNITVKNVGSIYNDRKIDITNIKPIVDDKTREVVDISRETLLTLISSINCTIFSLNVTIWLSTVLRRSSIELKRVFI